ncbi:lysozyme inhibitor LprI family protein [Acuticoccus kandeliae]|uniref:lysozyme inhibitor LprI family protein n=1 Tax=Acuticoccus kandeliae TaxID=2073160 RepID=UPI000D3E4B3A|nr:lysozyme inhibitor LprI family protein [Acuticoccus kandeliae]
MVLQHTLARSVLGGIVAAAFGLVLAPAGARAEGCGADANQSQLNMCADKAYGAADAALNTHYEAILSRLDGNDAAIDALRAAQRAWITFRDAECAFAASGVEGGSAYPMVLAGCLEDLTEARVEALEGFLACEEGDMSCPVPPQ